MITKWVCALCAMINGLQGSELDGWPDLDDEEAQAQHIEREHHQPVRRDGETEAACAARFQRENPEAGGPHCRCLSCRHARAEPPTLQ